MKPTAIVYTSQTGHTRQYALLLGEQIGLPLFSLDEVKSQLSGGSPVMCAGPEVNGLEEWQRVFGRDEDSMVADPGFADAENGDFTLPEDSPFFAL